MSADANVTDVEAQHFQRLPEQGLHEEDEDTAKVDSIAKEGPETKQSRSAQGAVFAVVATLCLLFAVGGVVVLVVLRRRRLKQRVNADFGNLEMRGCSEWHQNAGL